MRAVLLLLLLAGCERPPREVDASPGGRLEAAAIARGMIADPAGAGLAGVWASDTDRLCVVPAGGALRLGASVDHGQGQACAASGTVRRSGGKLRITFGDCRFDAAFDGERIAFPAALPATCSRFCAGRASLSSVTVERLSQSMSEAGMFRSTDGQLLCGS